MKLAITGVNEAAEKAPFVLRGNYEVIIKEAASLGFDAVELHIHDSRQIDREAIKNLLQEHNLGLSSIGTGSAYSRDKISLVSEDQEIRLAAIERIKEHILTAKDYDAVVIIGLIRGYIKDVTSAEVYKENLKKSLGECLEVASKYGVTLAIELLNRYECDFLNTIEEGLEFIDEINSPYLKLHIDTYHMNIEEGDIKKSILNAKGKIAHVHIADNDRWYAGHGHYNFKETIEALNDIGYKGVLAIESFKFPEPHISATKSLETLKKVIKEIQQ